MGRLGLVRIAVAPVCVNSNVSRPAARRRSREPSGSKALRRKGKSGRTKSHRRSQRSQRETCPITVRRAYRLLMADRSSSRSSADFHPRFVFVSIRGPFFARFVPSPHRYAKRCGRGLFAAILFLCGFVALCEIFWVFWAVGQRMSDPMWEGVAL